VFSLTACVSSSVANASNGDRREVAATNATLAQRPSPATWGFSILLDAGVSLLPIGLALPRWHNWRGQDCSPKPRVCPLPTGAALEVLLVVVPRTALDEVANMIL
jgi:hypothetical protein